MKAAGIIAEYNPFHNGHKYHIAKTKALTGADAVAVIMSGNFVQRGSCAIADKWTRAQAALAGGADLVIELPVYYSSAVAQLFAFGAVSTLDALGCIDILSFGTEGNVIDELSFVADKLAFEGNLIDEEAKKYSDNRIGYPAARQKAISSLYGISQDLLQTPNNMLAIEYLRVLKLLGSSIVPVTIERLGARYHDDDINSEYASATAIRKQLSEGGSIASAIPSEVLAIYENARSRRLFPVFSKNFDKPIISYLRRCSAEDLSNIIDMPHGFENRIISMAKKAGSVDDLVELCCARQYTRSRIRRLIFASYIGIHNMGYEKKPSYIRVLGINNIGKQLLSDINKKSSLPVITKTADYAKKDTDALFALDITAGDLYSAAYDAPELRTGGADFTTPPVIIN